MVKCNSSATGPQKQNGIVNLGVFRKELEILKLRNVILYTGREYDVHLNAVFDNMKILNNMNRKIGKRR